VTTNLDAAITSRLSKTDFDAWAASLPTWGDIVTKNLADVVTSIWTGKDKVVQFTASTYSTTAPTSTAPVNLGKSSKVTLTVRVTDDATAGFTISAYIYDGTAWQSLAFSVPGIANTDCAATVEFTTGADGRFYFAVTDATFAAYIYSAEGAP